MPSTLRSPASKPNSLGALRLARLRRLRELRAEKEQREQESAQARVKQFATPGALAAGLYPKAIIQTSALELLDEHLTAVSEGTVRRLMWFMPPQEGKSQRVSRWFPLWMLLRDQELRIAICSYELNTARRWGRVVRNEIKAHPELGLRIKQDTASAHDWELEGHQGGIYCAGVGGALTGRPVDLMIIDDPVKGRAEADSEAYREDAKEWWRETVNARLGEHTPVIIVMCMTGDTPVLMADGGEKPLRDVRPGDKVATYEAGSVATSIVRNWANQGPDAIYSIRMKSGRTVRANARHPFLTIEGGRHVWRRTDSLRPGSVIQTVTGGSGGASHARQTAATMPPSVRACACPTTTSIDGQAVPGRHRSTPRVGEQPASSTDTASPQPSTTPCLQSRAVGALSVASTPPSGTPEPTGTGSCAWTTTTRRAASEDCSATTATLWPDTASRPPSCVPPLTTWRPESDEVVEVVPCGVEDVFDLQIDRTENFIANGLVSHNTRWHEDDLAGWLLTEHPGDWHVVNIPALADHDPSKGETDPLGREPGEWLESARGRTVAGWEQRRKNFGERGFTALCQGRPAPAEGGMLKRGWWRFDRSPAAYAKPGGTMHAHNMDTVVQSWDMAFKDTKDSDYVVGQVWGRRGAEVHLLDQVRDRMDFPATCRAVEALSAKWPQASLKLVEDKANGPAVIAQLRKHVGGLVPVNPKDSKAARVSAVSPFVEAGNVYLPDPARAPWVAGFIEECAGFPTAAHDDRVDGMTQALARLLLDGSSTNFLDQLLNKPPGMDAA